MLFSASDDDFSLEGSYKKRIKPVYENAEARGLRELDRERLAIQAKRRAQLRSKLAQSGHGNDEDQGLIIINEAAGEGESHHYINHEIAKRIKKHQIDGVRFMWNQIVTIADEEAMQGCLLAHTMGLGKTMQTITLIVAIAEAAASTDPKLSSQIPNSLRRSQTLILCPPTLIDNWMDELLTWAPDDILGEIRKISNLPPKERLRQIADWNEDGGILICGYEMFRSLILNPKRKGQDESPLSDDEHELVLKHLLQGPNIIIADEAHKMKNSSSGISKAASQFRSKSRIALTGSPLANNVVEYHR
jgi:SNF2 family DNA or RNA helicase